MRKTVLALLLALVLTIPFAAAGAAQQEFLGMWYGTEVVMGETTLPIGMLGMEATMDIRGDGTALLHASGEETSGTWTADGTGTISIDDGKSVSTASLLDGKLYVESEGFIVVFEREPVEAAPLAEISTDATAKDFIGIWIGSEMFVGGVGMPMAAVGLGATFDLRADGQALFTMTSEGEDETVTVAWTMDGHMAAVTVEGVTAFLTIRGGRLVMEIEGGVLVFDREG
ncbi:MAG: hypothetical protein GX592_02390 [Clostridiales bacterium]|nr:hypothetical protein [Clostridiales bacterium]